MAKKTKKAKSSKVAKKKPAAKKAAKKSAKAAKPQKAKAPKAASTLVTSPNRARIAEELAAAPISSVAESETTLSDIEAASYSNCREIACESAATSSGYCRLHYIKNWKKIKRKELILKEGKLNRYIEELVAKYPDKYIEAIKQDLQSDKEFNKVVHDLDLGEGLDEFEGDIDNVDTLIDSIRRDFDDEGENY